MMVSFVNQVKIHASLEVERAVFNDIRQAAAGKCELAQANGHFSILSEDSLSKYVPFLSPASRTQAAKRVLARIVCPGTYPLFFRETMLSSQFAVRIFILVSRVVLRMCN
eukprot:TRINITY_DN892_c0_g1_i1.p1 TRINITY_DN892_c0_g1~~TRINITY_DN892_c0_g1_i1.p1  ORF type:complete len:110 (-),score=1.58 TRINITY_DN892_c0_g1_i1:394-723(-)